jgi:hypothetical protein
VLVTVPVVAVKLTVVAPAATVTEVGTVKAPLFEESATAAPPVGAANDKVTVQRKLPPDTTELGEQDKAETADDETGVTVTEAVAVPPLSVAVIVAV